MNETNLQTIRTDVIVDSANEFRRSFSHSVRQVSTSLPKTLEAEASKVRSAFLTAIAAFIAFLCALPGAIIAAFKANKNKYEPIPSNSKVDDKTQAVSFGILETPKPSKYQISLIERNKAQDMLEKSQSSYEEAKSPCDALNDRILTINSKCEKVRSKIIGPTLLKAGDITSENPILRVLGELESERQALIIELKPLTDKLNEATAQLNESKKRAEESAAKFLACSKALND